MWTTLRRMRLAASAVVLVAAVWLSPTVSADGCYGSCDFCDDYPTCSSAQNCQAYLSECTPVSPYYTYCNGHFVAICSCIPCM